MNLFLLSFLVSTHVCGQSSNSGNEKHTIYSKTEANTMAEYPGGLGQIPKEIQSNMKYPEDQYLITGQVLTKITVDAEGNISEVVIQEGINPQLDAAVKDAILTLKKFTPATAMGTPVASSFMLPVQFTFE